MAGSANKEPKTDYSASDKMRFYRIYKLLRDASEYQPITIKRITEKLTGAGFTVERKTVGRDIRILNEIGAEENFQIKQHPDNKKGFYLLKDEYTYDDWEIKILIDAVAAARFLKKEEAARLIDKLKAECSPEGQAALCHAQPVNSGVRARNFTRYGIDSIFTAIKEKKQITFKYMGLDKDLAEKPRRGGRLYTVNPYRLYWQDDRYYLIANHSKYNSLSVYRLDRVRNVGFGKGAFRPPEDILGDNPGEKLEEYIKKSIYRYGGKEITLRLFCAGAGTVADLTSRAGDKLKARPVEGGYQVEIQTMESEGLIYWLMQYGKYIRVLEPESVRLAFKEFLWATVNMNK